MQLSGAPTKIAVPFANSGTKNTIPVPSQIAITPGAASFTDGFPPLTFTPVAAGGVPPFGADFNGILNAITQAVRWQMAGGTYTYDSTFATTVGGYPKGAIICNAAGTGLWFNTADNNTSNPDSGGAGWLALTNGDGQCRLTYTSSTVITLLPENGNVLNVGGVPYSIPSGGVTLSNSGLSASTLYWIYAVVSGGALALQASTTGFTRQSDGRYTMTGNTAARLVGAVYTNASSQFVSSGTNQNVVSFFNRRALPFNLGGAGGTTTSTTLTPVNSGTVTCISFGLDSTAVQFLVNGYSSVSAGSWASGILVDGASGASTQGLATSAAAAQINNNPSMFSGFLSAGYHTLAGAVNVNTGGGSVTITGSMIGQTWG